MKTKTIILLVVMLALVFATCTGKVYGNPPATYNMGVVWSFGGVELYPRLSVFLCMDGISDFVDYYFIDWVADC